MMRPLEWFIGLRYLRVGRGRLGLSFMSIVSFLGIGLGVAALIVILSAMNGLEAESRTRLLSLSTHITLTPEQPTADIAPLAAQVSEVDGVASVAPFVQLEGLLATGAELRPSIIRGIDPRFEAENSDLRAVVGSDMLDAMTAGANRILLARFVASSLNVQPGDRVTVWLAEFEDGRPMPRRTSFTVGGVFDSGVQAHDTNLALMHITDASRLMGLGGDVQAVGIKLDNPMDVAAVELELQQAVGQGFGWSNWAEENRSLFQAMAIEKTMMTIVLMFIAGIAAFNIVASLTMVVNEKEKDIAILRTMGLAPEKLSRIFLIQGAIIGLGGTLAGVVTGVLVAANLETILPWLEQSLGFQIMPGDVYYVTTVPSQILAGDVALITGVALVITLLATVYPSRRAARIEPADVLRYE